MAIKKHDIIVLTISAVIAVGIMIIPRSNRNQSHYEIRVYRVTNGWGYDILVNTKLLIHQESIPVIQSQHPFFSKEQAEKTAQLVLRKLKDGKPPAIVKFELEKIIPAIDSENDQTKKTE